MAQDELTPGATGRYPEGKLSQDDAGELRFRIGADRDRMLVLVDFGVEVAWLAMPPAKAREFGISLLRRAGQVDGIFNTVSLSAIEQEHPLTGDAHRERHQLLHKAFDELTADYLAHNRGTLPSTARLSDLLKWSHEQTMKPTEF